MNELERLDETYEDLADWSGYDEEDGEALEERAEHEGNA